MHHEHTDPGKSHLPVTPSRRAALFAEFHATGRLRILRSPHFDTMPSVPLCQGLRDRVEGMLLGLAIGDSLGNTTEPMLPAERRRVHGEIRDYLPNKWAGGRAVGVPSDDTQMSFWAVEHLLATNGVLDPAGLAAIFADRPVFGIGKAVHDFRVRLGIGAPLWVAATESAGNGALMRAAPFVLPHLTVPSTNLWTDAALGAMLTHNDTAAIASSVAFTSILWQCLAQPGAREPSWWLDEFQRVAGPMEPDGRYESRIPGDRFRGSMTEYVERVRGALDDRLPVVLGGQRFHSGAYVLETAASVLHILGMHGDDPEQAMVRAVNDTVDNDTVASIVGAVLGALHGRRALPSRWIDGLTGRTGADDDGRVFELVTLALDRFVPGDA